MALKCLRANIPVLVSKTAATRFAVEIAKKSGLTLVVFALPNGTMKILSNAERLV